LQPHPEQLRPEKPERVLALAEEFEDIEAIVLLTAGWNGLENLDRLMEHNPTVHMRVFDFLLSHACLQPIFFKYLQKYPLPELDLQDLLKRHPEIRWTLEMHRFDEHLLKLNEHAAAGYSGIDRNTEEEKMWQTTTDTIRLWSEEVMKEEKLSAKKRDAFAALAIIARAARGPDAADGIDLDDLARLSRLHQVCQRDFSGDGPAVGAKRPRPEEPPVSPEVCLLRLGRCARAALPVLRNERCDQQFAIDVAWLVRLVEQKLRRDTAAAAVDLKHLLAISTSIVPGDEPEASDLASATWCCKETGTLAFGLKLLWAEVILSDEAALKTANQMARTPELESLLQRTTYCQILVACLRSADPSTVVEVSASLPAPGGEELPASCDLELLCANFKELNAVKPALRLAVDEAARTVWSDPIPYAENRYDLIKRAMGRRPEAKDFILTCNGLKMTFEELREADTARASFAALFPIKVRSRHKAL